MRNRLRVKPGITGMWQVNGRSQTTFDDYVRHDLYYVDNWTLLTDLAIVAKTVPVVLFRAGRVLRRFRGLRGYAATAAARRNAPMTTSCSASVMRWNSGRISERFVAISVAGSGPWGCPA